MLISSEEECLLEPMARDRPLRSPVESMQEAQQPAASEEQDEGDSRATTDNEALAGSGAAIGIPVGGAARSRELPSARIAAAGLTMSEQPTSMPVKWRRAADTVERTHAFGQQSGAICYLTTLEKIAKCA